MEINNILKSKSKEEIDDLEKRGFIKEGKWNFKIDLYDLFQTYLKNERENNSPHHNGLEFLQNMIDLLESVHDDLTKIISKDGMKRFESVIDTYKKALTMEDLDRKKIDDEVNEEFYNFGDDFNIWIESFRDEK